MQLDNRNHRIYPGLCLNYVRGDTLGHVLVGKSMFKEGFLSESSVSGEDC